jgi:hypothetical protein
MDRHGHLAIGLLAQGTAVLALHAHGVLALLGEGRVVDDKNALRASKGGGQVRAVAAQDLLLIPRALADKLLQGLVRIGDREVGRQGDARCHRLDALAVAIEEQALQVDAGPARRLGLREIVGEHGGIISKPLQDGRFEFRGVRFHTNLDGPNPRKIPNI